MGPWFEPGPGSQILNIYQVVKLIGIEADYSYPKIKNACFRITDGHIRINPASLQRRHSRLYITFCISRLSVI